MMAKQEQMVLKKLQWCMTVGGSKARLALENESILVSKPLFPSALHNPPNAPAQVFFGLMLPFLH